jgi:tRNA modification GTPase
MTEKHTIFALSSGVGRAGIAVIRLSGPGSEPAVFDLSGPVPKPRAMALRYLKDADGAVLDQAMVCFMKAPHSVTGEDMAEFHLHGSPAVVAAVTRVLGQREGFRMAEAGEFTRRAYRHGKMDLVAVEGLGDLLAAESDAQRRLAMRQFLGEASTVFTEWRKELLKCLAIVEASIDFADEDDAVGPALAAVIPEIIALRDRLSAAMETSSAAELVRLGLRVVIAGPPNAGKSSLVNWLVGRSTSIVSPIPGTTRDVLEARSAIAGIPVMVSDTAGIRQITDDPIEALGIARARQEISDADILVWMRSPDTLDGEAPVRQPDIRVFNKSDRLTQESIHIRNDDESVVSVLTGDGLEALKNAISDHVKARSTVAEDAVIVRERHRMAVGHSIRILNEILAAKHIGLELMAEKMRMAAAELASTTGRVESEDVLGEIFSSFCIGK